MPLLTEFAAAPQVRQGVDAAALRPIDRQRVELRRAVQVEAAVTGQQRGILPVQLHAFFVDKEHGNTSFVLRPVPDLLYFEVIALNRHFHARPFVGLVLRHVIPINGRGRRE